MMNPGPVEEAGATARSVVDTLKDSPFTLSLVVITMTLLGFMYFQQMQLHDERVREQDLLYKNREFVGDLLARCTMNPPTPPH